MTTWDIAGLETLYWMFVGAFTVRRAVNLFAKKSPCVSWGGSSR